MVGVGLLAGCQHNHQRGTGHGHNTDDAQQHSAVVAGIRQVEAGVVDHFQQSRSIGTAVILTHIHSVAVHGCGCGQVVVDQRLLGNARQMQIVAAVKLVSNP